MRRTKKIPIVVVLLLLAMLACNAALPPSESTAQPVPTKIQAPAATLTVGIPQTEDAVPRISVQDAKAAFDSGQAVIVDVRSAEAYAASHAQGAISIPLDEFENNIGNLTLEKDQWIITYCT